MTIIAKVAGAVAVYTLVYATLFIVSKIWQPDETKHAQEDFHARVAAGIAGSTLWWLLTK